MLLRSKIRIPRFDSERFDATQEVQSSAVHVAAHSIVRAIIEFYRRGCTLAQVRYLSYTILLSTSQSLTSARNSNSARRKATRRPQHTVMSGEERSSGTHYWRRSRALSSVVRIEEFSSADQATMNGVRVATRALRRKIALGRRLLTEILYIEYGYIA